MNTGVINLFQENLYWHMIIQGCFFSVCFMIGLSILLHSSGHFLNVYGFKKQFRQVEKIKACVKNAFEILFSALLMKSDAAENKKGIAARVSGLLNFVPILLVFAIITFVFGLLTNRLGDNFSDYNNIHHLGLKSMWTDDHSNDTDDRVKVNCFDKVFSDKRKLPDSLKIQMYYDIKHHLFKDDLWRNYLATSQTLINYTQVLIFSFFNLIIILIIDFFLNFLTSFHPYLSGKRKKQVLRRNLLVFFSLASITYFAWLLLKNSNNPNSWLFFFGLLLAHIIIIVSQKGLTFSNMVFRFTFIAIITSLYYASGISWVASEKEFDCKVFGVYKSDYTNTSRNDLKSIEPTIEQLKELQIRTALKKVSENFDNKKPETENLSE